MSLTIARLHSISLVSEIARAVVDVAGDVGEAVRLLVAVDAPGVRNPLFFSRRISQEATYLSVVLWRQSRGPF